VLLRGESGTGKEAIARAVHYLSPRKDAAFIKVNCAALTESLLESELFGHEKGAFTGAIGDRKGRFELAHGGTLFLDEIGDVSPAFQAKMLRVLQEREFERVGGTKPVKVDVRLICATNRDLEKMVQRGEYRADLYYRFNKDNGRQLRVTPQAMKVLTTCYWPGNVRELENCIERTATMVQGDLIEDFGFGCKQDRCLTQSLHHMDKADAVAAAAPTRMSMPIGRMRPGAGSPARPGSAVPVHNGWHDHLDADSDADDADPTEPGEVTVIGPTRKLPAAPNASVGSPAPSGERERLIWAMEQCGWVQAKAARLLKLTPRQMGYALLKHNIEVRKF
jgi:Nif-specific regulatory protein